MGSKTALDEFVDSRAPICYGILMPGEHCPTGVPVIKVKNIVGGRIVQNELLKTTLEIHEQYKRAEVREGDLLLTIRGTTGRVAIVPASLNGANITQDTARIRVSSNDDPLYVFYALQSADVQQQINLNTIGQAVKGINIAEVKKLKIFHPNGNEQRKISKILSVWDKAITTTEQLLANSQQQKKALMQKLLTGKVRLLDENGVRFEGEWVHGHLGDLCTFKGGSAFKEEYQGNTKGDFPFIKVSDMNLCGNEKYIVHSNNWVTKENSSLMKAKPLPADAVVFAKVGAALLLNRRRILSRPTIIDNNMMAAIPTKAGNTMFIYQLMQAIDFAKFVQDGAVPSVNQSDLAAFKISYPAIKEQQKIAEALSGAEREIALFQEKIDIFKAEKKALMQQLLTGKRRVKIEEVA